MQTANLPRDYFGCINPNLQLNLDEECLICSGEAMKILGGQGKKPPQNNMSDARFLVNMIRVGTVGSVNVQVMLLESGKSMHKRFIGICLLESYRLTDVSCMIKNKTL